MVLVLLVFFFKQKTAYEMRISDWSSDVCSSDLVTSDRIGDHRGVRAGDRAYSRWRLARAGVGSASVGQAVIPVPTGVRIWIATGHTDKIGRASCRERVCQYV